MSPHPIQTEIARLRRRARRLAWLQSASRFAAVGVSAILVWAVSDYVFRYREQGLRAIGLAAIVGSMAWAAWRFLLPLANWRLTDVDVAKRVDRRLAPLHDRVASALEFLQTPASGGDADDGDSARLRESVVADAGSALAGVKLDDVLDARPTLKATATALFVAAIAAVLFVASPDAARLALARLGNPGNDLTWPPRHRLAFDPEITHLDHGGAFEIRVIERDGNLPDEVWIEYADADERPSADAADSRFIMRPIGDAMVARREDVRRGFWYRAVGGDDTSMAWRRLTVVDAARLATCRITIHPPPYTRWPAAESPRAIRALVGSRVSIDATATRPLAEAAVVLESGQRIPLDIDSAGKKVTLPAHSGAEAKGETWEIDESRSYRFELTARDGTRSSAGRDERWEIQPIVDLPPVVSIEYPGGVLYATERAGIGVRVAASDDLAVARVAIDRRMRRGGERPAPSAHVIVLYAEPASPNVLDSSLARWPRDDRIGPLHSQWNLAALDAAPGDTIEFEAVALDRNGTETRSATSRIIVVTRDEFVERSIDRQVHIGEQLTRALDLARQSRRLLAGLLIKARQSGSLDEDDGDELRAVETDLRQLTRILVEPVSGVAPRCEELLADLRNNGVALPEGNRPLAEMVAEIRRLEREEFGPFDRALADAWTAIRSSRTSAAALAGAIGDAAARQERIVASLAQMHEGLARWDSVRRVSREIAEIRRVEQGLTSRVIDVARTTLGMRPDDLPADTRAELGQLVESQRDLRRRFDRTHTRMEKLRVKLEAEDSHAAGIVIDALDYVAANPIAGDLSAAADQIAANRLAQAARTQAAAIFALGELLSLLDNRPEEDPQRLADRLARALRRLDELVDEFDRLAAEIDRAATTSDDADRAAAMVVLHQRRAALADEIRQVSREAIRLEAMLAAERLARAAVGIDGLERLVVDRPATWPQAREAIRRDLVSARRYLQGRQRQVESQQIRERLKTLSQQVAKIVERQESLLAQSSGFEPLVPTATAETWRVATADAVERQRALAEETTRLAADVDVAAFAEVVRAAGGDMRLAAAALASTVGLAETMRAQRSAIERLAQVGAATGDPVDTPTSDAPPPAADVVGDPPPTPDGAVHVIEELRLLRLMQDSLNARTAALDKRDGAAGLSEADQRELAALADEQQRIANLLRSVFVDAKAPALRDEPTDDGPMDDGPPIVPPVDDVPSPLGM